MTRLKALRESAIVALLLILLFSSLPLGTALEFSKDEGFELMKGLLRSKGYALYTEIWSDQPPLFTLLLASAFKVLGPSILVARLIAAGLCLLMLVAFHQLVRQRLGSWPAALATFFLLASPVILEIGVSVMQEVPTFATALLSARFLFQWKRRCHWGWLVASGATLGIALQIKFTASLIAPAMLLEIILSQPAISGRAWLRRVTLNALQWVGMVGIIFTVIGLIWGRGSSQASWKAHFTGGYVQGLGRPEDFAFPAGLLFDHAEVMIAAIAGIALLLGRRQWKKLVFPMTLLLTAVAVHAMYRPWWMYYYLHFAIPLAWLAGLATSEAIQTASRLLSKSRFRSGVSATWKGIALCSLAALALTRSVGRLEAGAKDLRQREKVETSSVIAKMKENAHRTRWVYADNPIYPFHARLLMPPELAVVTPKRFWSDQITTLNIMEECRRRRVEQLVLDNSKVDQAWRVWLSADYSVAYREMNYVLYVVR